MQQKPTLYLMLGYPGAGKTTAAEIIHDLTGAVHMSSDKQRLKMFPAPSFSETEHAALYSALDRKTEKLLQAGQDVIYDANLNRHRHRVEKYTICERVGATPVLIWVKAPKELAKTRASHTSRLHLVPHHESPEAMFNRIARVLEEPHPNEPYTQLDGTKITPGYIKQTLHL